MEGLGLLNEGADTSFLCVCDEWKAGEILGSVFLFFADGRDLSEKEVLGVFLFSPVAFAFGETDL